MILRFQQTLVRNQRFMVLFLIAIGILVRSVHLLWIDSGQPWLAGGLFWEFATQIVQSGYKIPESIPYYTDNGIPFVYPPLAFYIEGFLVDKFALPNFGVVIWLPAIFTVLTVPLFWRMLRELPVSPAVRVMSLLTWALLPAAYWQQIRGSGLAEALGTVAIILLATQLFKFVKVPTLRDSTYVGLAWGLSIVSSPGSAVASFLLVGLFVLVFIAQKRALGRFSLFKFFAIVSIVGLGTSSFYWISIISNGNLEVVFDTYSAQSGGPAHTLLRSIRIWGLFEVSNAWSPILWQAAIFLGLVWVLLNRPYLGIWMLLFMAIPKEGDWLSAIPAAILGGIGITKIAAPFFSTHLRTSLQHHLIARYRIQLYAGASGLLALYLIGNAYMVTSKALESDTENGVTAADVEGLKYLSENTPESARFIFITGGRLREWAPSIMQRTVLNVPQGAEWDPADDRAIGAFNSELLSCEDVACVGVAARDWFGHSSVYFVFNRIFANRFGVRDSQGNPGAVPFFENDRFTALKIISNGID